jgi:hypothetical protein
VEPLRADPPEVSESSTPNRRAPLPTWLRVTLIVIGVVLVVVGIAGLVLPGLQGIVTILAGLALLSLVSRQTHGFLRWTLRPWPKLRKRVERLRRRFQSWLHRKLGRDGVDEENDEDED